MKLDRNINPDGMGRYALIQIRDIAESHPIATESLKAKDTLPFVAIPSKAVRLGNESPGEQFFVLKYKDKFAAPALEAYAKAVRNEVALILRGQVPDNGGEINPRIERHANELMEFADEIEAEAKKAASIGRKTPTPLSTRETEEKA